MKDDVSLFINTATKKASIALLYGDKKVIIDLSSSKKVLEELIKKCEVALSTFTLTLSDVTSFYLLLGPGSNTGIRLGLCVPRTIYAINPDIKLFGINTMKLMCLKEKYCSSFLSDRSGNLFQGIRDDSSFHFKRIDKENIPSLRGDLKVFIDDEDALAKESLKNILEVNSISIMDMMITYKEYFEDFSERIDEFLPIYASKL